MMFAPIDDLATHSETPLPTRTCFTEQHRATAIGMPFVRSHAGISQNPAESMTAEDTTTAASILLRFIRFF